MRYILLCAVVIGLLAAALTSLEQHEKAHANLVQLPTTVAASCPVATFNGTTGFAQTAALSNLTSVTHLSVSAWANFPSYNTSDGLMMELGPNAGSNAGSFFIDPNYSGGSNEFAVSVNSAGALVGNHTFTPQASAAAWHHYLTVIDLTVSGSAVGQVVVYVDGSAKTLTDTGNATSATFFAYNLNIAARNNGAADFLLGDVGRVAIWGSALTSGNATSLAGGASPNSIATPLYYWLLTGTSGSEANVATGGGTAAVTLTNNGTTTAGPSPCPTN